MNAPTSPRIANASRHSGFTLLEVLFALVLMAIAMAAVWGALHAGAKLTRNADAAVQRSDRVRAVQQFLREYLGGAQPQAYASGGDKTARMFDGAPRQLTWVAQMPAQLGDGGLFVQTMQLLPEKDGHGYTLQLSLRAAGQRHAGARERHARTVAGPCGGRRVRIPGRRSFRRSRAVAKHLAQPGRLAARGAHRDQARLERTHRLPGNADPAARGQRPRLRPAG